MNGKIDLDNPIRINGEEVRSMNFDTNEITAAMFAEADMARSKVRGKSAGSMAMAAELDPSLHTYLGFMAIRAVNPSYDLADLERLKGHDAVSVMRIGRSFFTSTSAAPSDQSSSGDSSGTTPEPSTPPSEKPEPAG